MSLSNEQVLRVASLARIELTAGEAGDTLAKLNGILGLIEQMQAVDTGGVAPMSHPQELSQRLREDAVTEPDRRDDYLKIAPATENGLYLVPKVIE